MINELQSELQRIESTEEQQKERFKKELDKLIPDLIKNVGELKEAGVNPKYLDKNQDEREMLRDLTEKWEKYEEFEATAAKYNQWQEKLEIAVIPFTIVEELQEIIQFRKLLWKSKIEWRELTEKYKVQQFKSINDKEISKKCDEYSKYVGQLERQLDYNEIQVELKADVENYKGAMPVVLALKNDNLQVSHWEDIKQVTNKPDFDPMSRDDYTLENLLAENVVQFQE